jgi:hypothetical protein
MREFGISRVTLFSFLLAAMLGLGLRMWNDGHKDACSAFLRGEPKAPATMYVVSGTRTIEVPCRQWFVRMPMRVQMIFLAELGLAAVFVLNALGDFREWLERRSRRRGREA